MKKYIPFILSWEMLLIVVLAIGLIISNILSPYFLTSYNFASLSSDIMERAIMALPMTLIIIAGEIDLSVASVLGLSSVTLGILWSKGDPLWFAIAAALVVGIICGIVNGLLITRLGLPSLVITIGTLGLYRGMAYVVLGDQAVSNFPSAFTNFGFGYLPGTLIPWSVMIFAVLAIIFIILLHFSTLGRILYAIGINKEAARFAGIPVNRIKFYLFILSSLIAAFAGIIFTARFSSARPDNALGFELDVVTIVLLGGVNIFGGKGRLLGVILAVFIVAILHNILSLINISGDIQNVAIGLLLILSVLGPNIGQRIKGAIPRRRLVAGSPE